MSEHPGVDVPALAQWLDREGLAPSGTPIDLQLIAGGRSNLTYFLSVGDHDWVLRRPPVGHGLATAHDVGREHRVISALGPSDVPVPPTVAFCADEAVLGASFYVMERVDGWSIRDEAEGRAVAPDLAAEASGALVSALVALHAVDPGSVGLGDYGRPDGYAERQVRRWVKQWEGSSSDPAPARDALAAWLLDHLPTTQRTGIVHGDFRFDNVLLSPERPTEVRAILDWELSTLGDVLTDLGLLIVYWNDVDDVAREHVPVAVGVTCHPGYPSRHEIAEQYARESGLDLADLDFYVALGRFKFAAICEGIYARFLNGQGVGEGLEAFEGVATMLVEHALAELPAG